MCHSFHCYILLRKNPDHDYVGPNTATLINFPMSNNNIHVVKDELYELIKCTTNDYEMDSNLVLSNADSKCSSLSKIFS